ncbi:flavin-dependent dehydrogenase, partial [Fischerella thermalis WC442]
TTAIRSRFPHQYPEPPTIDLSQESIFEALAPYYPLTVKYFQKMPNGEYDLQRVYWWEQRWRQGVRNPQKPRQVVFSHKGDWEMGNSGTPRPQGVGIRGKWGDRGIRENSFPTTPPPHHPTYDLIYIGGALGVIHAAVMAKLGYKVLLVERLPFGRMNREWNI